jgi:predicted SAM-dependent methyltransferase
MKVIIGSGNTKIEGWVSTQEDELNVLSKKDLSKMFENNSVDVFLAEHVFEHMTIEEGIEAATNIHTYLKPGGYFRCAVPDAFFRNEWYQNMVQVGGPGPVDHPAYSHKVVYDYKMLTKVFEEAGFYVELLEYCDENGVFHYKYWNSDDGYIGRSYRFDTRNDGSKLGMVSLILDAHKRIDI